MPKFLNDNSINQAADDHFGHVYIAKQIGEIINEENSGHPINIGLFGKWGVGKSSIVELLENLVLKEQINNEKLKFIKVNIWKYHSVNSIRNIIFYQIAKKLELEEEVKKLYESSTTASSQFNYKQLLKKYLQKDYYRENQETIVLGLVTLLPVFSLFLLLYRDLPPISSYVTNFLVTVITSATILKVGLDFFSRAFLATTTVQTKPFESEEQFEHAVINLFNRSNYKDCKKILFIDDLDRCASTKVLGTLETVKTFLQIQGCIFIIASDHEIIKKAVIEANKDFHYNDKEASNYLEKFFRHFIFMPPFIPGNIRDFTRQIISNNKLEIEKDLTKEILDNIVYILAYKDIINPRKIKVLLNSFVFEYYSTKEKEDDVTHLLKPGLVSNQPEVLAILVVLKIDFPLFINDLILEPSLAFNLGKKLYSEIEDKRFIKYINDNAYSSLREYLELVAEWIPYDITPHLFVSIESSSFSALTSSEYLKYSKNIRDGRIKQLESDLKDKPIEFTQKIIYGCGHQQASLTNSNEKKNATIVFTYLVGNFWDQTLDNSFTEGLYAFRTNYNKYIEKDSFLSNLNISGLTRIITCYSTLEQPDISLTLFSKTLQNLSEDYKFKFLISFLKETNYNAKAFATMRSTPEPEFSALFYPHLERDNYEAMLEDFLSSTNAVTEEELLRHVIDKIIDIDISNFAHKSSLNEEQQNIDEDEEEVIEEDVDESVENVSNTRINKLIIHLVENRLSVLFEYLISSLSEKSNFIFQNAIVDNKNLLSNNVSTAAYLLSLTSRKELLKAEFGIYIQKLIAEISTDEQVIENIELVQQNILTAIKYLRINPNSDLEDILVDNLKTLIFSSAVSIEQNELFVYEVIAISNFKTCDKILSLISNYLSTDSSTIKHKIEFIEKYSDEIISINDYLELTSIITKYGSTVSESLIETINDNEAKQAQKKLNLALERSLRAHVNEDYLQYVSFLNKIRDLMDINNLFTVACEELIKDSTTSKKKSLCLQVLMLMEESSDCNIENLKSALESVKDKTYKSPKDGKLYYFHDFHVRLRAIELLVNFTSYDFSGNLLKYFHHFKIYIPYFKKENSFKSVYNIVCSQNDLKSLSPADKETYLHLISLVWKHGNHLTLSQVIQQICLSLTAILDSDSKQKKNEQIRILKLTTGILKSAAHKEKILKTKDKDELKRLHSKSISQYKSLNKRWTEFSTVLEINLASKRRQKV